MREVLVAVRLLSDQNTILRTGNDCSTLVSFDSSHDGGVTRRPVCYLFRSQIIFEVKPWDTEVDLKALFHKIVAVGWGISYLSQSFLSPLVNRFRFVLFLMQICKGNYNSFLIWLNRLSLFESPTKRKPADCPWIQDPFPASFHGRDRSSPFGW